MLLSLLLHSPAAMPVSATFAELSFVLFCFWERALFWFVVSNRHLCFCFGASQERCQAMLHVSGSAVCPPESAVNAHVWCCSIRSLFHRACYLIRKLAVQAFGQRAKDQDAANKLKRKGTLLPLPQLPLDKQHSMHSSYQMQHTQCNMQDRIQHVHHPTLQYPEKHMCAAQPCKVYTIAVMQSQHTPSNFLRI